MNSPVWANYFTLVMFLCTSGYWYLFHSGNRTHRIAMRGPRIPKPKEYTRYLQVAHDVTNVTGSEHINESSSSMVGGTNSQQNSFITPNSTWTEWKIDLDVRTPSIDELYDRLVVVTSFSSNHFNEALGFILQVQKFMPNKTIVVYDLGLEIFQRIRVRRLCSVQLRPFPFGDYPPYFRQLKTYAFKPTIINLALDEFGVIYYGDASIRFHKSAKELIPIAVKHHGFLGHIRCFNPKLRGKEGSCFHDFCLTRREVYPIIGVDRDKLYEDTDSVPAISGGLMLLVNSTYLQEKLMKPWKRCAANKSCIAPDGATLKNHRFDQSALTLLAYKNMYREFTPENDPTPLHLAVATIKRGYKPVYHPFECWGRTQRPNVGNAVGQQKNTTSG